MHKTNTQKERKNYSPPPVTVKAKNFTFQRDIRIDTIINIFVTDDDYDDDCAKKKSYGTCKKKAFFVR